MNQDTTTRAEKMYEHVKAWQASDLRQKEYCKETGLTYSCFKYWKQKYYKQNKLSDKNTSASVKQPEHFIPVEISGETNSSTSIKVLYPNGVILECNSNIDFHYLQSLINLY